MRRLFCLLLFVSSFVLAQNIDIPFQKFVLPNGLTLIVHEDHKAPIVAVNIWYHVGSKNERAGKTGFAHLFEHLMFGGSEHFHGRYLDAMERIGATDLNGTTSEDRTNYFETVPVSALDYTLWMESDRMGYMVNAIDQKTLDLQRGVVQNEKRQDENQPYSLPEELIQEDTYPSGHPYSWPVIGSMEDLNAASLDDVKTWFKTWYGPSNAVLVVAGDIDPQTVRQKVEKYFGEIPSGPPVKHQAAWVAKMTGTHRAVMADRVPQARVYQVWNMPEYGSADGDYLDMVSDVLANGHSSRLYKRLVYDDQIATDAGAFINPREIGGQFIIQASARPGVDLARVEKALDEELARFLAEGPTAAEVARVRTQYLANFVRGVDRIGGFGGKSDVLASSQVFQGDPAGYKLKLQREREATPAEIQAAAKRWLADGEYILEVYPFGDPKPSTTAADRNQPPPTGQPPALRLPKIERTTLSNGLKLVLAERHEIPLVNFDLLVDSGFAADQFASPGTASLAATLLDQGTPTRSAMEISEQLAQLGANLNAGASLDTVHARLSALKSNLDTSLAIYADVLLNPTFPQADFAREQKQQLAAIEREKSEPTAMALRMIPGLLYGKGHAYSEPWTGSGTPASVAALTRADMVKFHDTWFKPNNSTLIVVGDTTIAEIRPKIERLFAAWKPGETPKKNVAAVSLPQKSVVYLVDKPGADQSVIIAGDIAPPKNNPAEIAIESMNNILGGDFGARINMNLREDKHWSYGSFSFMPSAKGERPYMIYAPVQTDKTREALVEINKEVRGFLGDHPATAEELARVQASETLRLPGSRETIGQVMGSIEQLVEYGLPEDYYDTYAGKVRALTLADIAKLAAEVVHPAQLVWVVVGDRSRIEAGIRELGLGDVRVLTLD
jgi:zinc protease